MERLVDDLLALARADEGAVLAHTEELDLAEIFAAEAERVEGLAVDTAAVDTAVVRGDRQSLRRAVRNLLDNARRHAASRIVLRVHLEGDEVQAVVEDEGVGIPDGERSSIFDAFIQSSKTDTGSGGTGLGLAICREIIESHGGSIEAENNPEGGASFLFTLPLTRLREASTDPE